MNAPQPFRIAQVSPYPWEDDHEVNAFVECVSAELALRGHGVLVLAPSRSPDLVRESRRRIRAGELFDPDGGVSVLGVGELLPLAPARRGTPPAPPLDVARTIEEVLANAPLDFVHVHEPFAPSASSVALRHSRALNVGSFHAPTERVISTQVARRFVERFFGRLDARTASFEATRDLMARAFPARYRLLPPGAATPERTERPGAPVRIAFVDHEERQAVRLFLRALRRLPAGLEWEAVLLTTAGAPPAALRSALRDRVTVVEADRHREDAVLAGVDIVVAASIGQSPTPGLLVAALGAGAVPVAARLAPYEDVLEDGRARPALRARRRRDARRAAASGWCATTRCAAAWRSASPPSARASPGARWPTAWRRSTPRSRPAGTRRARAPRPGRSWSPGR